MGTGSSGGAGSGGSGGSSGGGGGGGGGGGYHSRGGQIVPIGMSPNEAREEVSFVFSRMLKANRQYFDRQFSGPLVQAVFREMFGFSACLRSADPKQEFLQKYGVPEGAYFLRRWADKILAVHNQLEEDARVRETIRRCVDEVLLKVVKNHLNTFIKGTCDDTLKRADLNVLDRLSGFFLWSLIWQVVLQDVERPPEEAELAMKQECKALEERIIEEAKTKFFTAGVRHAQLFEIIASQLEWFRKGMRS